MLALVAVAEHVGEFEKIIHLSQRWTFTYNIGVMQCMIYDAVNERGLCFTGFLDLFSLALGFTLFKKIQHNPGGHYQRCELRHLLLV